LYCYLKKGVWANGLGGDTAQLKSGVMNEEHAYHLAMSEIIEHRDEIIRDGGLFMTFTSDPCVEETYKLFCRISESAREMDIPVTILTKADPPAAHLFLDSIIPSNLLIGNKERESAINEYLANCQKKASLLAIGFTLTGHDELEPNASPNEERVRNIDFLVNRFTPSKGCHVWASIEPVIDFPSALDMVYHAVNAGCEHFKIGLLTNNTRLVRKDFAFGEHHFDAYKMNDCLHFIEDVMRVTDGKATVYWKQSVRDLLGDIHSPAAIDTLLDYPHAVGKEWNIFK
jgi:DNA repair photolyase